LPCQPIPAFADQLDERQRWDLASYIASFTADPAQAGNSRFSLAELAGSTPEEIAGRRGAQDAAAFRAQRARPPQAQRGPQELLEFSAKTLEQSLQAYRAGRSEQAYDLAVAAYLEGFELVESALDNLDPLQRKSAERALMAYRQALQDAVSPARAAQALAMAKAALDESAKLLVGGHMNAPLSFLSSLLILLREGLEAILVLAGAATALLLVGLAWVVLSSSRKLPLATFFSANAILLCVLSVVFAGHGVAALAVVALYALYARSWLGEWRRAKVKHV
jgi:high-affinity iron transporter